MSESQSALSAQVQQMAQGLTRDPDRVVREAQMLFDQLPRDKKDQQAALLNLIAMGELQRGQPARAKEACLRGLRRHESAWLQGNLAVAETQLGEFSKALRRIDRALELQPNHLEFHRIRSVLLVNLKRFDEAHAQLEKSMRRQAPVLYHYLNGWMYRQGGDTGQAIIHLEQAISLGTNDPGVYFELRLVHVMRKDYLAALEVLERLEQSGHRSPRLLLERALVLEVLGRLDDAESAIREAMAIEETPEISVALANIERRRGHHGPAAERLEALADAPLPGRLRADIHYSLGQCRDALGQPEAAIAAFGTANETKRGLYPDLSANRARFEAVIERQRVRLGDFVAGSPEVDDAPVFLVGFPRSGTTLLGRILDIHSQVRVHEEARSLNEALLANVDDATARQAWLDSSRRLGAKPGMVAVDQMPINLALVPRILACFPKARFVMLHRDPRDACLSAWMQNFEVNDLTVHFLDLAETVGCYETLMTLWQSYLDELPPFALHTLRYESLIEDPKAEIRALCGFLGLTFESDMLDESKRVGPGQTISTASYAQVGSAISTEAVGRYHQYETLLSGFDRLAPFIEPPGATDKQ